MNYCQIDCDINKIYHERGIILVDYGISGREGTERGNE